MWEDNLTRRLRAARDPEPPPDLRARLEQGIPGSFRRRERLWDAGRVWTMAKIGAASAAAMAIVWAAIVLLLGTGGSGVSVAGVLDPVARASEEAAAVHLVMRVLSREGEDFGYVDLGGTPMAFEAWIELPGASGGPARARISKGDRVYACDGRRMITYHPPRGEALRSEGCAVDLDLFWPAAWLRELQGAPPDRVTVLRHDEADGTGRLLLREPGVGTVGRPPAFLQEFDRETEVAWDRATHRLTGLRRWVLQDGRRLVSELVSVEYLPAADDALFALDVPAGVRWVEPREAPPDLAALGPREVALQFLQAAQRGDRETLELLGASPHAAESVLGMHVTEVVSVGQPFRTGAYPGVYVPYEIRAGRPPFGIPKRHNLAVRNDNDQRRWVFDGGI